MQMTDGPAHTGEHLMHAAFDQLLLRGSCYFSLPMTGEISVPPTIHIYIGIDNSDKMEPQMR